MAEKMQSWKRVSCVAIQLPLSWDRSCMGTACKAVQAETRLLVKWPMVMTLTVKVNT